MTLQITFCELSQRASEIFKYLILNVAFSMDWWSEKKPPICMCEQALPASRNLQKYLIQSKYLCMGPFYCSFRQMTKGGGGGRTLWIRHWLMVKIFIILKSYILKSIFYLYLIWLSFFFTWNFRRAALNCLAGRMRPMGRSLGTRGPVSTGLQTHLPGTMEVV